MTKCNDDQVLFTAVGRRQIVTDFTEPLVNEAEAALTATGQKQRLFGETENRAGTCTARGE